MRIAIFLSDPVFDINVGHGECERLAQSVWVSVLPGRRGFRSAKVQKRLWHVLEDSGCQILQYSSEDIRVHKTPLAHVDIKAAAITLDLDHQNQFIILCDKKEHIFTAENHESMMIWLLGLQATRDAFSQSQRIQDRDETFHRPSISTPKQAGLSVFHHSCLIQSQHTELRGIRKDVQVQREVHRFAHKTYSLDMTFEDSSSEIDSDEVFREHGSIRRRRMERRDSLNSINNFRTLCNCSRSMSNSSDSAVVPDVAEVCVSTYNLTSRLTDLEKELISTKCELAKVMNQQTCFQEILYQREDRINMLESKVKWCETEGKIRQGITNSREIQERVRVQQNQNRFLNEEVKKLAKIRQQDRTQFADFQRLMSEVQADIDKWKRDYVSLIQSSIRYPWGDTVDEGELSLFGGNRHKHRVQELLEEARVSNPRLPTYDSLDNGEVHVDCYGFKHQFDTKEPGLLLHYLCQQLSQHYISQASTFDQHQKHWALFIRQHGKNLMKQYKEMKKLCRNGIPEQYRRQVWHQLVQYKVRDLIEEKGDHYYQILCNIAPESPTAACYKKQISLDLLRTMPTNIKFSTQGAKGIVDLQNVLLAFCIHNPVIGYCQGMNFIVAVALLFLDPSDAFWALVAVTERFFPVHYFDHSLIGAQADQMVLNDILQQELPAIHSHLEALDIDPSTVTLNWFLAIFFDAVPFQTLLRIWDCFLLEGSKVLFRFSIAILKLHEKEILQKIDTISIMRHLKACARSTYDVDGIAKIAFEDLKPFARRQDIVSKQACYLNLLKEQNKHRDLQRLAFAEREQMYLMKEAEAGDTMAIECCTALEDGKIWMSCGDQIMSRLSCVNADKGIVYTLSLQVESRVMCMLAVGADIIILGTLSWMLYAYNTKSREELWQMQLHDAVLSLLCRTDDVGDDLPVRIFAGLADGTIAIMESIDEGSSVNEIFYIPVGQAPVTCLTLVGEEDLWCASGNTVHIIHAGTLDAMDSLVVSLNPYDHILSMVNAGDYGVWIALRGSSILELWDSQHLCCKLLYDTQTDKHPQLKKGEDTYFNRARITSILSLDNTVWLGTGEGDLIIYEVTTNHSPSISSKCLTKPVCSLLSKSTPELNKPNEDIMYSLKNLEPVERDDTISTVCYKNKCSELDEKEDRKCMGKKYLKGSFWHSPDQCIDIVNESEQSLEETVPSNYIPSSGCDILEEYEKQDFKDYMEPAYTPVNTADEKQMEKDKNLVIVTIPLPINLRFGTDKSQNNLQSCTCSSDNMSALSSPGDAGTPSLTVEVTHQNQEDSEKSIAPHGSTEGELPGSSSTENGCVCNFDRNSIHETLMTQNICGGEEGTKCKFITKECLNRDKLLVNGTPQNDICFESESREVLCKTPVVDTCTLRAVPVMQARSIAQSPVVKSCCPTVLSTSSMTESADMNGSPSPVPNTYSKTETSNVNTCFVIASQEVNTSPANESGVLNTNSATKSEGVNTCSVTESENVNTSPATKSEGVNTCSVTESEDVDTSPATEPEGVNTNSATKSEGVNTCSVTESGVNYSVTQFGGVNSCTVAESEDVNTHSATESEGVNSCSGTESANASSATETEGVNTCLATQSEFMKTCLATRSESVEICSMAEPEVMNTYLKDESKDTNIVTEFLMIDTCSLNKSKIPEAEQTMQEEQNDTDLSSEFDMDKKPKGKISVTSNPELKYRLELSGISVETDTDRDFPSGCTSGADETVLLKTLRPTDLKLDEFLKSPTLSSRQEAVLRSRFDKDDISPNNSIDIKMAEILHTPDMISSEEITPLSNRDEEYGRTMKVKNSLKKRQSIQSGAGTPDQFDLKLQVKMKIADKPVHCLTMTKCSDEQAILSFSGCYGDDEAVLKWMKEAQEKIWTNSPILEICPETNETKLPSYMRARVSSTSSHFSIGSLESSFSIHSTSSQQSTMDGSSTYMQ
ncbi:hypothetical protein ScPMuIL_011216 [Solemya velum]